MSKKRDDDLVFIGKQVIDLWRWVQRPHWTLKSFGWLVLGAVSVLWILTGSWNLAWQIVLLALVGYAVYWLFDWVARRVHKMRESGIPFTPAGVWHMIQDLITHRKKFTEKNELWADACASQGIEWKNRTGEKRSPRFYGHELTSAGDVQVKINPSKIGGDIGTISQLAVEVLPPIMQCREIAIYPTGRVPGEHTMIFRKEDPLKRTIPINELMLSGPDHISFGVDSLGEVAKFELGINVFVCGASKSGKSSLLWAAFNDLVRDGTHVQLWPIDPKRMELAVFEDMVGEKIGNVEIMDYLTTAEEATALFKEFKDEMHNRQARAKGQGEVVRSIKPTAEFPARIIFIDEALDIQSAWAKGMTSDAGIILSQGRSTKDCIWAMSQVGTVQEIGAIRKGFQLRAGMRMGSSADTLAALGIPESEGLWCTKIPFGSPGVGYYVTDEGHKRKFRANYSSDKQIADLVIRKQLPKGMITRDLVQEVEDSKGQRPCYVYVAPDVTGNVVYVGKAFDCKKRFEQHRTARRPKPGQSQSDWKYCSLCGEFENFWVKHVDEVNVAVLGPFPSEPAALLVEQEQIDAALPIFNVVGNEGNPRANRSRPQPRSTRTRERVLR